MAEASISPKERLRKRIRTAGLSIMGVLLTFFLIVLFTEKGNLLIDVIAFLGILGSLSLIMLTIYVKRDRDITERKLINLNEQLLQYAHLHSHELRGPLARVLGLINVSKMTTDSIDYEWYFHKIETEAVQVDKVLTMMRHELNKIERQQITANLNSLHLFRAN